MSKQEQEPVQVRFQEIEKIVRKFKTLNWSHLLLHITSDGQITASGLAGRTDLVLGPTHFFFSNAFQQSEETILYSFKVLLRHREGYVLEEEEKMSL